MKNLFKLFYRGTISFKNAFITEWNSIKSDKAVSSTFLSVTFIILIVYTYIYSNQVIKEVPVAIVNQDGTKMSRDYIAMLESTEGTKTITSFTDLKEAKKAYYSKEVEGIVIVPKNFEKNIRRGKQTTITTFADAANMLFYKRVLGDVSVVNGYFSAGISIKKELAKGISYDQAQKNYSPIKTISNSLFNTTSGYATYLIPMLTALIIQLVLLMGIGLLSGSRREVISTHTEFPRILHKGGVISVLLAKACLYTLIYMIIIPVQVGVIYALFGIPVRSSLLSIYIFIIPYVFSVVFLGISISSFFKRREDSIVFLVLLSIPSLMLSGLSFPVEGFTLFYNFISELIPSTPGILGFVKLTQMEASFLEVLNQWNHLWILTFIYFIIAAISLKIRAKKEFKLKKA
ncbi:ABC transporter permease [Polaribacter sargassicola]|uniref:ABC transporter permease n=1 Tax=Polaribacter sargassicola TaxID=2836891 RepID=UPI001F2AC3AC|nr:ABC transporter permease [Polaribacter sp. DS7-9]MCG1037200.1 ABC-2 transporter permease [Polaribacter sp. DS7-9]